jgi:hypothetical protein
VQAASYALTPFEHLLPAESLVINAAAFMRAYNAPEWTISCAGTPPTSVTITYSDRDTSGTVSIGDVINVPAADCGGVRRKLTFTLTQFTAAYDELAGHLEVDIEVDAMRIVGAFDASLSYSVASSTATWRIANAAVTLTKSNTTQSIRIASGQFVSTPTTYSLGIAGGSVESEQLGGNYTFATVTPLTGAPRRLPSSGELLLSTASGSRVRVTPPATPGSIEEEVEYAVAATGSAVFAPPQRTLWTAIVRGLLFGWRPNEAPTLTNLSIQPADPAPGANVWVSYNAQDANGDVLQTTFEWRRNGVVVSNTQYLGVAPVRGDQITVTVTVSDGRLSATATTSVTISNPRPVVTSLTLTPEQPNTTVDLVAVPNVFDPDGDPVTITYEWQRNGTVVANRTDATLPASETTRGDTIVVLVKASDGVTTVEATASTTIIDAPPRLIVLSPPTTVAYGAPVAFTATVEDPDDDSISQLSFALAYGPAGMSVDPDTGVVSWTAGGPMFDRTMTIGWGVTVNDPSALLATGTLQVTDSTRDYPQLRFGTQIPTWPAGLSVADHDDDGDTEMLVMGQRHLFELEADGAGGYRQSWAYPFAFGAEEPYSYNSTKTALATGDVDGDGPHEIFVSAGRVITKLDGVDRRREATLRLTNEYEACADLVYTDLGNDGAAEVLCLASADYWSATSRILVLRASDLSLRYEFPPGNYGRSLAVGNVDTDAALEIVTAGGYVFDGELLVNEWLYGPGFGVDVDTGDFDGNGVEEIVAAADWTAVRGYSATLKSPIWELQDGDLDSLLVADIGGDARPEILVGDGQWGDLTIYRYNTSTNALDVVDQINSQEHGVTSIGVGDVDADGQIELVWGSGMTSSGPDSFVVAGRNPTLAVEWTNADPLQLDGPFRGGALAGGPLDPRAPLFVSLRTESGYGGSRLVRVSGDGGDLEISAEIDTNWSGAGTVDIVDYDNDGVDEAFLATNALYSGLFAVYDFFGATTEWSSGVVQSQASSLDVTHADFTGDGRADLVGLTSAGVVYIYDVYQQALFWQSTTISQSVRVIAADIDGSAPGGEPEMVVVTSGYVYVYRESPPPIRFVQAATYQTNRGIIDAAVGDTDSDGDVEVVLLVGATQGSSGSEVIRLNSNLQAEGSFELPWAAQTLDIESTPTPRKNLLVSRLVGSDYDSTIAIVGARSGGVVFESPPLIGSVQRGSVHYVTLPGETSPRMSIGTSAGMYLTR